MPVAGPSRHRARLHCPTVRTRKFNRLSAVPAQTRIRLLELAVARLGKPALSARLRVPSGIVEDWLSGTTLLPDGMVIALIDLIDETGDK
jgi:hypothetical protein